MLSVKSHFRTIYTTRKVFIWNFKRKLHCLEIQTCLVQYKERQTRTSAFELWTGLFRPSLLLKTDKIDRCRVNKLEPSIVILITEVTKARITEVTVRNHLIQSPICTCNVSDTLVKD